jgi:ABC-2 type transport system permease protein
MNKTLLIFRHEFLNTIKRTGFIIMTLIVPLIGILAIGIIQLVSGIAKPTVEITTIGYIDESGGFQQYTSQGSIKLVSYNTPADAIAAMVKGDIKEYIVISSNYTSTGVIHRYTLQKQLDASPAAITAIKNFISSNMLAGKVPSSTISLIETPLNLVTTRITATGAVAAEQGGYENLIVPGIFSLLLILSIIFSSSYLLQGLGDEKESRLIEVLLSSVSARQLFIGKVLGIGVAGLVQVVVWVISIPLLLHLASSTFGGFISTVQLPADVLVLAVVYFILGYSFYSVISAGIGAVSSNSREGQQIIGILTLPALVPLWFSSLQMLFPENPIWVVLAIFPFSAPVEAMLRMGITGIGAWELSASIIVMVLSIIGILFLVIKVFRIYLLMYGKRPGLREIIRSLRNS